MTLSATANINVAGPLAQLSDRKFQMTIMNMLRALVKRINNIQEHINNIRKKMKTLGKIKRHYKKSMIQ